MQKTERQLRFALINMGVNPGLKGFSLLVELITEYTFTDDTLCDIYKAVCAKKRVTFSTLERSVRTCLGSLKIAKIQEVINNIAGCHLIDCDFCLTMSSFVSVMGEVMKTNCGEYFAEQLSF